MQNLRDPKQKVRFPSEVALTGILRLFPAVPTLQTSTLMSVGYSYVNPPGVSTTDARLVMDIADVLNRPGDYAMAARRLKDLENENATLREQAEVNRRAVLMSDAYKQVQDKLTALEGVKEELDEMKKHMNIRQFAKNIETAFIKRGGGTWYDRTIKKFIKGRKQKNKDYGGVFKAVFGLDATDDNVDLVLTAIEALKDGGNDVAHPSVNMNDMLAVAKANLPEDAFACIEHAVRTLGLVV